MLARHDGKLIVHGTQVYELKQGQEFRSLEITNLPLVRMREYPFTIKYVENGELVTREGRLDLSDATLPRIRPDYRPRLSAAFYAFLKLASILCVFYCLLVSIQWI